MAHCVVRDRRCADHRQRQATDEYRESSLHEFPRKACLRAVYGYRRVTGLNEKTVVGEKTAIQGRGSMNTTPFDPWWIETGKADCNASRKACTSPVRYLPP